MIKRYVVMEVSYDYHRFGKFHICEDLSNFSNKEDCQLFVEPSKALRDELYDGKVVHYEAWELDKNGRIKSNDY